MNSSQLYRVRFVNTITGAFLLLGPFIMMIGFLAVALGNNEIAEIMSDREWIDMISVAEYVAIAIVYGITSYVLVNCPEEDYTQA